MRMRIFDMPMQMPPLSPDEQLLADVEDLKFRQRQLQNDARAKRLGDKTRALVVGEKPRTVVNKHTTG